MRIRLTGGAVSYNRIDPAEYRRIYNAIQICRPRRMADKISPKD
jgi:hypothetical protein